LRAVDTTDRTFLLHVGGKIEQRNKHALKTRDDLSMAYTPQVARVCQTFAEDRDRETPQPPQAEVAVHADAATGVHRERRWSRSACERKPSERQPARSLVVPCRRLAVVDAGDSDVLDGDSRDDRGSAARRLVDGATGAACRREGARVPCERICGAVAAVLAIG
jgi:hypothetical protein